MAGLLVRYFSNTECLSRWLVLLLGCLLGWLCGWSFARVFVIVVVFVFLCLLLVVLVFGFAVVVGGIGRVIIVYILHVYSSSEEMFILKPLKEHFICKEFSDIRVSNSACA